MKTESLFHILPSTIVIGSIAACLISELAGADSVQETASSRLSESRPAECGVDEIFRLRVFPEPLVPIDEDAPSLDSRPLMEALRKFELRECSDDFSALENFISENPSSPWRLAVQTDLGLLQYRAGYFSKCIDTFKNAWETGRAATNPKAKALADRAAGEYSKMLSRIGRHAELKAFLATVSDRTFEGSATELIAAARQGLATMEEQPEIAFRCGPLALGSILVSRGKADVLPKIENAKSTMQGISLSDVAALSQTLGMNFQPAKRSPGASIIVPSVIHWKVGHYAALLGQENDRYHSKDPTFENDSWHSRECIDAESSGWFLVPSGPLPEGWSAGTPEETAKVFGKGATSSTNPDSTTPYHKKCGGRDPCKGMAVYSFHTLLVSLNLTDTPVGYRPPYGPAVDFTTTYNQRESGQPSNFNYSNLGGKWTHNWLSYVADDPATPASASVAVAGGGFWRFSGYIAGTGAFAPQSESQTVLRRTSTNPIRYELEYPDGSLDVFARSDGSSVAGRKIFLTERRDPCGNTCALSYDGQLRISAITDALGQSTTLFYENANAFLITRVRDPFGREAVFSYNSSGRLIKIRDVIGIESQFTYLGTSDFIQTLTTPYGSTTFTNFESGRTRRLTATDPLGDTEVLEYNENTAIRPASDPANLVPQGMLITNNFLHYRNSYFWDRKAWKERPGDYAAAHNFHWVHAISGSQAKEPMESEKPALSNRVWYLYPGTAASTYEGTMSKPNAVGLRLDDGSTQLQTFTYNSIGKVISATDPLGRKTNITYAANQQDVVSVSQQGGGVLATFTYTVPHLPDTSSDAAGQVTSYTYNTKGQITSLTNPKGEVTTYSYHLADVPGKQRKGRILSIDGPLAGNADTVSFDYDPVGKLAQVTGPDGYTLSYTYDALDRFTRVTYPDATYEETTYEALDPKTLRDRLGRITTLTYNGRRQLVTSVDPAGRTMGYEWCRCGGLKRLIDPMNRATSWRHDVQGRVIAKEYVDGSMVRYVFEPLSGRLSSVIDEKGQVKKFAWNRDDSLAGISYLNALISTSSVSFFYDPVYSRMTSMADGTGLTTYSYHPVSPGTLGAGQLATMDSPLSNDTITYTYDQLGRRVATAVNGVAESLTLDPLGRVAQVTNPLGAFGYTYDGATSRLASLSYPGGMTAAFSYNSLVGDFRLKNIVHTLPGGSELSRHSYEYDAVGNITRWTQVNATAGLNRTWLCGYDSADQLASVTAQDPVTLVNLPSGHYTYTYDQAGNRLTETIDGSTTSSSYNALNQIVNQNGSGTATLVDLQYEWDAENRLVGIVYPGTTRRTEFEYDGMGCRRVVVEKDNGVVTERHRFVWDGLRLIEERDASGSDVVCRYFENGMQVDSSGVLQSRLFAKDQLGSVQSLVSSAGTVVGTLAFDPWGRRQIASGLDDSRLTFTGHWLHSMSGCALAPLREYMPANSRWIKRDPIGELGGFNLYRYAGNNPVGKVDRIGAAPESFDAESLRENLETLIRDQLERIDSSQSDRFVADLALAIGDLVGEATQGGDGGSSEVPLYSGILEQSAQSALQESEDNRLRSRLRFLETLLGELNTRFPPMSTCHAKGNAMEGYIRRAIGEQNKFIYGTIGTHK